jgi:hypothetical protein
MGSGAQDAVRRWLGHDEHAWLVTLYALTLGGAVFMALYPPATAIVLMFPLLLAALVLSPRRTTSLAAFVLVVLAVETLYSYGTDLPARRVVSFLVATLTCLTVVLVARRRAVLGVAGVRTDAMLTDLRERVTRQGRMPALPPGWYADMAVRSAGGTQFAGDFLVTRKSLSEDRLDLVLVDVSGKGVEAGPKSLLLSGAFGALIAAVPPREFLSRANDFVLEQDWDEGFATAIHLSLDLRSGSFSLWSAGHPPAVHFRRGSGSWDVCEGIEGPALGLLGAVEYKTLEGRMLPGDVLLLFTDGLIERSHRDLSVGLDSLLGEGERLLRSGFEGVAGPLVEKVGAVTDDCALVVLHRRG